MIDSVIDMDTRLFLFLNSIHSPFFDKVMNFVSGKPEWIPLYGFILGWLIYKFKWKSVPVILAIVILITLTDQLSVLLFKETFQRLRPCRNPDIQSFVHIVNNHCGGKYGFISNHAANSFALATFTSFIFKNSIYCIFIFIWAIVVSYSRIYLGVHYPGDVLGGMLFGIILAVIVYLIFRKLYKSIIDSQ